KVGFPIRKSADQSFFAAPRGLSQRSTSFIASQRQGIHQMPLRHLIALIINAHSHSACDPNGRSHEQLSSCADSSGEVTDLERPVLLQDRSDGDSGQASPTSVHYAAHHHERTYSGTERMRLAPLHVRSERSPLHDVRQHAHEKRGENATHCMRELAFTDE